MQDLEDQAQNQRSAASSHYEELLQTRTRLDGLSSKYSELESSLASAQAANKDLRVIIASIGIRLISFTNVGHVYRAASPIWRRAWTWNVTHMLQLWHHARERSTASAIKWQFSCKNTKTWWISALPWTWKLLLTANFWNLKKPGWLFIRSILIGDCNNLLSLGWTLLQHWLVRLVLNRAPVLELLPVVPQHEP